MEEGKAMKGILPDNIEYVKSLAANPENLFTISVVATIIRMRFCFAPYTTFLQNKI